MLEKIKLLYNKFRPYVFPYAIGIALAMSVGIASAAISREGMNVYERLNTPPLSPPGILFPIVWTILYILMGVSSAMIYINKDSDIQSAKDGLTYYAISLALNFSWSILFFNLQAAFFALLILLLMLYFIAKTIVKYKKVKPIAAYLQIPYLLWVAFAGYLNGGIWLLN